MADALRVVCPTCAAPLGDRCVDPDEVPREPHKDRVLLAEEWAASAVSP